MARPERQYRCFGIFNPVLIGQELPMETTARLFNCARCRRQVVLCSHCDRGNIYCSRGCARQARRESVNAARRRYQRSRRGRFSHAERQRRYRARQRKVTHQGSPSAARCDSPAWTPNASAGPQSVTRSAPLSEGIGCHRCGRRCSAFIRLRFLRGRARRRASHEPLPRPPPVEPGGQSP